MAGTAGGVMVGGNPNFAPPPGYTREPNTGRLIPLAGSPTDVLGQRTRQQGLEDEARQRTVSWETADRGSRDALRSRLMGMLDRPTETSAWAGSGGGAGGAAPISFDPSAFLQSQGSMPAAPTFDPSQFASLMSAAPAAPAQIGTVAVPDTSAAQANLFARAKDKVGLQTQGSLASLRSALAGRGMLGGGAEVRGAQNILQSGQGQLGDVTREQAIQEANRQTDFAKLGYEGAISQRGQDITARGQDLGAQESARDAALKAALAGYEGQLTARGQTIGSQNAARADALRAAMEGYQGQITQRGQDISARQAAADRAAAGNRTRYDSVTGLLGKLY